MKPIQGPSDFHNKKILTALSHPDDETIGCGASISRATREGAIVRAYLPFRRLLDPKRDGWESIQEQFRQAVGLLGATPVLPSVAPCESETWNAPHAIVADLLPHIEWADIIFTHWHGDVHQSHRTLCQAVEIATRPFRLRRKVLQCEIPTSSDQSFMKTFSPNLFVQVYEEDVKRKLSAMSVYKGELAPGRTPVSLDRSLRMRGDQIGVEFAECFSVARWYL